MREPTFSEHLESSFDTVDVANMTATEPRLEMCEERIAELRQDAAPVAVLLHLGTTHFPYATERATPGSSQAERYELCIEDADDMLAPFFDSLSELATERPLYVIYFSDHGEEFEERGGMWHGFTTYAEVARAAFAVVGPDVESQEVHTPNSLIDIAPTMLSLAGAPVPPDLDGLDLTPTLRGAELPPRPIASELYEEGFLVTRAVVYGHQKAIAHYVSGVVELFDLEADPGERENLVDQLADAPAPLRAALGYDGP
jgi:arylsulfatase A-like enzyme